MVLFLSLLSLFLLFLFCEGSGSPKALVLRSEGCLFPSSASQRSRLWGAPTSLFTPRRAAFVEFKDWVVLFLVPSIPAATLVDFPICPEMTACRLPKARMKPLRLKDIRGVGGGRGGPPSPHWPSVTFSRETCSQNPSVWKHVVRGHSVVKSTHAFTSTKTQLHECSTKAPT